MTRASLAEVDRRGDPQFSRWARDVEDAWLVQSAGPPEAIDRPRVGSISVKDWALIADALDTGCDAFLTMDRPLASQAPLVERKTGL